MDEILLTIALKDAIQKGILVEAAVSSFPQVHASPAYWAHLLFALPEVGGLVLCFEP